MPECPLINAPLQPEEEPILEKLISIRDRLETLKRDRSTYVKSCDVVPLYDELIEQVEQLNSARKDMPEKQNRGMFIPLFSFCRFIRWLECSFQVNDMALLIS